MSAEPGTAPAQPPGEPRFPGRDRILAGGAAVGLIAVSIVLLSLPADDPLPAVVPSTDTVVIRPAPARAPIPPPPIATPQPLPPPPAPAPVLPATQITTNALPRGAIVTLDGKSLARRRLAATPGRHILSVTVEGFALRTDTVNVAPGQTLAWNPRLMAVPRRGSAGEPGARRANPDDAACRQSVASGAWRDAVPSCMRAADAGLPAAQRSLAIMYLRGDGVRRSDDSAARWLAPAARSGDPEAMYQLGIAYERGRGVSKDQVQAVDWYTRGATAGNADAQFVMGETFEKGRLGVRRDRTKALEWYRRAAAQGHKAAASRVKGLER